MNSAPDDELIPTRRSLLARLKDWEDRDGWKEFFDTYWRLIFNVALKAGRTETEAEDVVQETVVSVARQMPAFQYDPKGSFKAAAPDHTTSDCGSIPQAPALAGRSRNLLRREFTHIHG